ncbi:MAG: peptidase MA family metallohydrolase [Longimicrobiales bacterium]
MSALLLLVLAGLQVSGPRATSPVYDTLRADGLRFHYVPRQRRLAEGLAASPAAARLPGLSARAADRPIDVVLAPDEAAFVQFAGRSLPDWSAGYAVPARALVVLPAFASERAAPAQLRTTLRHELAHVRLHRYLAPVVPPRWFDEGYARYAAGEWDADAAWQLRLAFALGRVPPLDSIALGWPAREIDARLAYMLATTVVQYLVESSGPEGLAILFRNWRELGNLDRAVRATYGVTLSQLEEDWRGFVRRRYGWALFLSHAAIFWFFGALLLVLLFWKRRQRDAEKLERLRATEPPDTPVYWGGGEGGGGGDQE